jgi:hypothetical protein
MEEFLNRLERLLQDRFEGAKVDFEPPEPEGRVHGFLIWGGFEGHEQLRRQRHLWRVLRKELSPDEQASIGALLTVTPSEILVMGKG